MKKVCTILSAAVAVALNSWAQNLVQYDVYLRSDFGTDTMYDGNILNAWGITGSLAEDPSMPAKTLYCNEGDSLVLHAMNPSSGEKHSMHLYGLDADTRNDGDPLHSFDLSTGQDTTYGVKALHAGTYIYESHVTEVLQTQMGMYGLIVARAANGVHTVYTGGPAYDRAYNWILSEVDEAWHDNPPPHDPIEDTVHMPPYHPNYFLINGHSESQLLTDDSTKISGVENESILLRIGAIGFFDNLIQFPSSLNASIISSDGRPLPFTVYSDTLRIAPGERYDVLLQPADTGESFVQVHYINMNTDSTWNTQMVPVSIQGAVSSAEPESMAKIQIFPNPSDEFFSVASAEPIRKIIITSSLGKQVTVLSSPVAIVDVSSLEPGIYFLTLETETRRFFDKILIAH